MALFGWGGGAAAAAKKKQTLEAPVSAPAPSTIPVPPPLVDATGDMLQAAKAGAKQRKKAALGSSLRDRPLPKPGAIQAKLQPKALKAGY